MDGNKVVIDGVNGKMTQWNDQTDEETSNKGWDRKMGANGLMNTERADAGALITEYIHDLFIYSDYDNWTSSLAHGDIGKWYSSIVELDKCDCPTDVLKQLGDTAIRKFIKRTSIKLLYPVTQVQLHTGIINAVDANVLSIANSIRLGE
ncbi:hypothetical protein [Gynuella sp.]|uniref:hypothetical protein n=1 Tax=Gynuella sp. TaxID=2969146 RepID=UPI003D11EB9D